MRNPSLSALAITLLLAAMLPLRPALALALVPPAKTSAAHLPQSAIQVTVYFVRTWQDCFNEASHRIAPGNQHDALLLAALRSDQVEMKNHPAMRMYRPSTDVIDMSSWTVHDGALLRMPLWYSPPSISVYLRIRPSITTDGLIVTRSTTQHRPLPPIRDIKSKDGSGRTVGGEYIVPATAPSPGKSPLPIGTNTFQDGQTLILDRSLAAYPRRYHGVYTPCVSVFFVTVKRVPSQPAPAPKSRIAHP